MKIGDIDVKMVVIVDKTKRVVAGLSDTNIITTDGYNFLFENELGDIKFIPLDDGTVQAVAPSKGTALPVGTMNSEQFITASTARNSTADEQEECLKTEKQADVSACEQPDLEQQQL